MPGRQATQAGTGFAARWPRREAVPFAGLAALRAWIRMPPAANDNRLPAWMLVRRTLLAAALAGGVWYLLWVVI